MIKCTIPDAGFSCRAVIAIGVVTNNSGIAIAIRLNFPIDSWPPARATRRSAVIAIIATGEQYHYTKTA